MITSQRLASSVLLFLPLPPSTNARMRPVRMGRYARSILTDEARDYIDQIGLHLKSWAKTAAFKPIDEYAFLDMWFILPRVSCDSHNYMKVTLDAMEAGGIFSNDKFALCRTMGVFHNAKEPQAIIKLDMPGSVKVVPK